MKHHRTKRSVRVPASVLLCPALNAPTVVASVKMTQRIKSKKKLKKVLHSLNFRSHIFVVLSDTVPLLKQRVFWQTEKRRQRIALEHTSTQTSLRGIDCKGS